jgi:hypothetical protein
MKMRFIFSYDVICGVFFSSPGENQFPSFDWELAQRNNKVISMFSLNSFEFP